VRREHALGSLHVAQLILEAVDRNQRRAGRGSGRRDWPVDPTPLSEPEIRFTRLAALLHDVGHLPSGHTFEDELGIWGKHDHLGRLQLILNRSRWNGVEVDASLRDLIDERYGDLADGSELGLSASEILILLVAGDEETKARARDSEVAKGPFRIAVCRDVVGSTICADLLDYLHRDCLHRGKPRHFDTRLLQYMELLRPRDHRQPSMLAVDLREQDAIRPDAISSIA
jgi:HD superfamily phosphohydrolase